MDDLGCLWLAHDIQHCFQLGLSSSVLNKKSVLSIVLISTLCDLESAYEAIAILSLLTGDDDPLTISLNLLTLAEPHSSGWGRAINFGSELKDPTLLDLLHLGEFSLDCWLDLDDLEDTW